MADQQQLEQAILQRPNDASVYAVYGDWLQAQGDPRGELVSVQAALASTRDTRRFLELKKTEERLLATVTAPLGLPPADARLTWRFGFVHHLEVIGLDVSVKRLLEQPAFRFVQGVRLAMDRANHTQALEELIAAKPPLLNRLELTAPLLNLEAFCTAFPRLEHFAVDRRGFGAMNATPLLQLRELRSLELIGVPINPSLSDTLRQAPWKKLRRVVLRIVETADRGVGLDDVSGVLALPELKQIGLSSHIEGAIGAVCKRTNLSALQELELYDWCTNEGIAPLLKRAEAIRGLKLVIHGGELSEDVVKRLRKAVRALALNVEVYGQEEAGVHEMDEEEARSWREREERLERQSDYNHDEWN